MTKTLAPRLLLISLSLFTLLSITTLNSSMADEPKQEFYELRVYKIDSIDKQQLVSDYLEKALLPALGRLGLDRVGVFTRTDDVNDHSIFVLIPYPDAAVFTNLNASLAKDEAYQAAAKTHFARPLKDPEFVRIESRFMKAFAGMPVMEQPARSKDQAPRIFELRLYESHTEDHAARKVEMFNKGEIQIMRDVEMSPVFYGETLIGPDVPNLVYMLSADDMESHQEHWQAFLAHPEWDKMKKMERYQDTVSNIQKWFLKPTAYSQL